LFHIDVVQLPCAFMTGLNVRKIISSLTSTSILVVIAPERCKLPALLTQAKLMLCTWNNLQFRGQRLYFLMVSAKKEHTVT